MPQSNPQDQHINQLRIWRNRPTKDISLRFLNKHFRRNIEKPHKQLGKLITIWQQLVPENLEQYTALKSFSRNTLTIQVPNSSTLYQLDQLLRQGLEQRLRQTFQNPLRRVKLEIAPDTFTTPTNQHL